MKLKLVFIYLFIVFVCIAAYSQNDLNISGNWKGTAKIPFSEDINVEYQFTQDDTIVQGYAKSITKSGKDSTKYTFLGEMKDNTVNVRGIKFIYKVFGSCLSVTELKYSRINNVEKLTGRWHGDLKLSTCPPGISGAIELTRVSSDEDIINSEAAKPVALSADDTEGNSMINELSRRKYFALIIGINDYADEGIQDLDNPVKDAYELKHVLETFYTFDPGNVRIITNPTRATIIEAFDSMNELITERDHFLVFYAGHGIWDDRLNQGFWLPADARLNSKAQWLSNSTIRDYIGGIKSKHTLLISDACFSGSIFKERGVSFENSRAMLEMYKLVSRKAMTSGALKTVPDQSVFISYLNKALVNNDQPLLSAEELFRSFKVAVINNSPNGQVPQYGAIGQVGDEGGDFIFLRRIK